jgi:hypothetical protein
LSWASGRHPNGTKDALSRWLLTFDVQKAGALPNGTQQLFARIFGEHHLSIKCVLRSAAFSLGAMTFIGVLLLLIDPKGVFVSIALLRSQLFTSFLVLLWLPWSIIVDYISLFKTRVILRILTKIQVRAMVSAIAILVL